jgi:hypothetical protein
VDEGKSLRRKLAFRTELAENTKLAKNLCALRGKKILLSCLIFLFFSCLLFGSLLKYSHVCRQANVTCSEPVEGNRQQLAPFPVGGAGFSGEPARFGQAAQVLVSADTRKKALFVNKAKVLNIWVY